MSDREEGSLDRERRASRSLIAALVAGGLAFSASLYPAPDEVPIFGLLELPGVDRTLGLPIRVESISVEHAAERKETSLADLLQVAQILARMPLTVPAETFTTLVQVYGLGDVLEAAGITAAPADVMNRNMAMFGGFGGGGGGGASGIALSPAVLAEWLFYLNAALHRLPVQLLDELSPVLGRLLTQFVDPVSFHRLTVSLAVVTTTPPVSGPAPAPALSVAPVAPDLSGPAPHTAAAPPPPPQPSPPPPPPQPSPPPPEQVETYTPPTYSASPMPTEAPPSHVPDPVPPSAEPAYADNTDGPFDGQGPADGAAPDADSPEVDEGDGGGGNPGGGASSGDVDPSGSSTHGGGQDSTPGGAGSPTGGADGSPTGSGESNSSGADSGPSGDTTSN